MGKKTLSDGTVVERKGKENRIIITRVVSSSIDRGDLILEKQGIEQELAMVLSDAELLEWARKNHPGSRVNVKELSKRLVEINELLEL